MKPFTLRQLKEFDTIDVSENTKDIIMWFIDDIKSITHLNPFLYEGVIKGKVSTDEGINTMYLYFLVNGEEDMNIQVYTLYFNYEFVHEGNISIKSNDYETFKMTYKRNGEVEKYKDTFIGLFFGTFAYIEQIKNNKDVSIKYEKESKGIGTTAKSKPSKRIINISKNNNIIYKLKLSDNVAKEFKRQYTRHIEAWNVAGHYREYKNGKRVYIKPFVKGTGKIQNKTYKV